MADAIEHIESLAGEIGPRPATSEAEQRASAYIEAQFAARGLETAIEPFTAPRSNSWQLVIYNVLIVLAAVGAGAIDRKLAWLCFALAAIDAFFFAMDLDTRFGLSTIWPKGPSQNVVARHVPKTRRGDRLRKVVVVAHYDSARASLAASPGAARNYGLMLTITKWVTFAVPVLVLAIALPVTTAAEPWLWYLTMLVSAVLLVPIFMNVFRAVGARAVDGANGNASGVAAMLAVMEALVPETEVVLTGSFEPVRRGAQAAIDAEMVPEGALLSYTPAGGRSDAAVMDLPDDFTWAEVETEEELAPQASPSRGQRSFEFNTGELEPVENVPGRPGGVEFADDEPLEAGDMARDASRSGGGGFLGRFGGGERRATREPKKRRGSRDAESPSDWLGVDSGFDAREAGGKIGSWDNFGEEDDEGWKGGWAGDDPIEDDDFASQEAARIRRRVTESVDRELSEKEVWFVATGAEEVGGYGMQAFLREHGADVRDAFILNLNHVGAGSLAWVTEEGLLRGYRVDRRLTGLAKRVSRENDILVKPHAFRLGVTDATVALARGFKAMSVMAFEDGRLPDWHTTADTVDHVDPKLPETAADFVGKMIREI